MGETLTDLRIKNARPKEKRYTLFDSGGLYLEIAPNGSTNGGAFATLTAASKKSSRSGFTQL